VPAPLPHRFEADRGNASAWLRIEPDDTPETVNARLAEMMRAVAVGR
jgi:hypothetical protein